MLDAALIADCRLPRVAGSKAKPLGMVGVRETIPKLRLRMPPTHYSQKIVKPIF